MLMVYNIIITLIDTAAIGAAFQRLIGAFYCVLHTEDGRNPAVSPGTTSFRAGDIDLLRVKNTVVLGLAAAQAIGGSPLRRTFPFK